MMAQLHIPEGFQLPGLIVDLAAGDTMYDGRDDHYLAVGLSALRCIEAALGSRSPARILDLPCGFGRVTRMLRARYPKARITVSDLDRPGVDFAAARFDARGHYSTEDLAALELGETFDLIWVGSLVTHLSEAQTRAFLQTMYRAMAPGAALVVSSHGPTIADGLKTWLYGLDPRSVASVLDDYVAKGYGHRGYGASDGYGISLTDRTWWDTAATDHGFTLQAYDTQAWDSHQDIVALRRLSDHPPAAQAAGGPDRPPSIPDAVLQARKATAEYDGLLRQFDTAYYLDANPDVAAAIEAGLVGSAYDHYRTRGHREGRRPYPGPLRQRPVPPHSLFDEDYYRRAFPDVAAAITRGNCLSGYDHWLDMGRSEGRAPHG